MHKILVTNTYLANLFRLFICSLTYCLFINPCLAAPMNGDIMLLKQPDGSRVEVKVYGDEYYQRIESLDGYTLTRNNEGWICFGEVNNDGTELIATDTIYQNTFYSGAQTPTSTQNNGQRLPKSLRLNPSAIEKIREHNKKLFELPEDEKSSYFPAADEKYFSSFHESPYEKHVTNPVKGLTLLIDFPDVPANVPRQSIERFFNEIGYRENGNDASIREYFNQVSGGKFDYTNTVTAYYTAQNNKSYYDSANSPRTRPLIKEALDFLESSGFDFTSLTLDNNNRVVALNVLYAGYPDNGWAKGLWPHKGSMYYNVGGVTIYNYQITNIGNRLSIRTTCHENGHLIMGWPDLYDYGGESLGIGNYGLMGYGGSNVSPTPPNPYFRALAGWQKPNILEPSGTTYIEQVANDFSSYKYENPNNSREFFIIESVNNGPHGGRYRSMPDQGVLIWHIDEYGNNGNEAMTPSSHYKVSVEQADGKFDLEKRLNFGQAGDLFHANSLNAFTAMSWPNSNWWDGSASGLTITNISHVGPTMHFEYHGDSIGCGLNTFAIPSRVEAEHYCNMSGIETEPTTDTGEGNNVGWIDIGDWMDYTLDIPSTGRYELSIRVASAADSGQLQFLDDTNSDATLATIDIPNTGGWQNWTTVTKEISLDAGTGTYRIYASGSAFNINWFELVEISSSEIIANGTYQILNVFSGKALDVSDISVNDGANIHQWAYVGGSNQKWQITSLGDGSYSIISAHSGKALDAVISSENGANIQQWSYGGAANQRWRIEHVNGSYYRIISVMTGKALDVEEMSSANGANVYQWDYVGGANQQWMFFMP